MDYCIPRYRFHMDAGQRPKAQKPLSKKERRLLKILKAVPKETIIGHCIHNTLDQHSTADFRKLISELKDQLRDAPVTTTKVLGEDGITLLKQL